MAQQQQDETVRDVMSENAPTVGADTSVTDVARVMLDENVGIVAVVNDSEELIGVVTDRDIALMVVTSGREVTATTVGEIMSAPPVTVGEDDNLDQALQRMIDADVRRAPVTEESGHVSGMLSQDDAGEGRRAEASGDQGSQ